MSVPTYQQYLLALSNHTTNYSVRLQLCDKYGNVTGELTNLLENSNGSITRNLQNGSRASITVSLINDKLQHSISPDSIWMGQMFQLQIGVEIANGEIFWVQQGWFCLTNPTITSNFSERRIEFSAVDKFANLDGTLGGVLSNTYIIPTTVVNLTTAIKSILIEAGDPISPIIDAVFDSVVIPYTITKQYGSNYGELLQELASFASANIGYTDFGQFFFQQGSQDIPDNTKPTQQLLGVTEVNYMGASSIFQFDKIFNSILIIGDNVNGNLASAKATNDNLLSPTRVQLIGEKLKVIEDSIIPDDTFALSRANWELKRLNMIQSLTSIKCAPLPHLRENIVVSLTDPALGYENERFLIQSLNYPNYIGGIMELSVVNVNELSFNNI